jgi:hypothetical protein
MHCRWQRFWQDKMYLPLLEIEGKGTGLVICLAVKAINYQMSQSFTANRHSPSSFVPISVLLFRDDVFMNF